MKRQGVRPGTTPVQPVVDAQDAPSPREPTTYWDGINECFEMALEAVERASVGRPEFEHAMKRSHARDLLWSVISIYASRAGSFEAGYAILRFERLWKEGPADDGVEQRGSTSTTDGDAVPGTNT